MSHYEDLGRILTAFGAYYDKVLTPVQLSMYIEDLLVLTPAELTAACKLYRQDLANERFPLPAKLIALARPQPSPEDIGRETVAAIINAVHKHGWNNPGPARTAMGELGWSIIERMGGWATFCQDLTNENMTTMRAQIRDLATTMARSEKREADRASVGLSHSADVLAIDSKVAGVIGSLAKQVGGAQ